MLNLLIMVVNLVSQLVWSKKIPCGESRMVSPFVGALPPLFLPCGLRDIFRAF